MLTKISILIRKNIFLILIILLAAILRFTAISEVPPSLNWDEVSHGYNAYSILKTGKDEWEVTLPTIFRAYGDYKLPVYIYATAISEAVFGLNSFAVRLPSALAGIVTVFFTYLLVKELFGYELRVTGSKDKTRNALTHNLQTDLTAILSALLVALEPWSLFLSRGAFEANLALAFFVSGVYFFIRGLRRFKSLVISALFFGLSVWTYNSYRIITPLFILFLILLFKKKLKGIYRNSPSTVYHSLITAAVILLPMFYQLINPVGQARYSRVAIIDEGAIAQINNARNSSSLSPSLKRIVYNKGTFFISRFAKNWASHYSGNFLFLQGGSQYQFSIPGKGLLYPLNAVFLIIGVLYLLKRRTKGSMFILGWFILGPVASSLTREAPHVLRSITMLPAPMILIAVGFIGFINWFKSKFTIHNPPSTNHILIIVYCILLAGSMVLYLTKYSTKYRSEYSWSWQYGYEQAVIYIKDNYHNYDKIIMTKKYGEPHEFILFYWPWNPTAYRNDPYLNRFNQSNWYWVDSFDKFYFVNDWQIPRTRNEDFVLESGSRVRCMVDGVRCLLITSPGNVPEGWNKLETIYFLDGKPAFEIYSNSALAEE